MSTEILEAAEQIPEISIPESVEDVQKSVSALSQWLTSTGLSLLSFVVHLVICVLVYLVIRKVLNRMLKVLNRYMESRSMDATVRHFITALIRYTVLGFVLVTIIVQLKIVQVASIAALIASAGVGISLAMQGVLSNFAGGLLLLLLKPFREGDYIIVNGDGIEGTVTKIEIYYTTIHTLVGTDIMVPNAELTNHAVQNMSADHQKLLVVKVGISYNQDIQAAKAVVAEIQREEKRYIPGTEAVIVDELGESAVVLAVRGFVKVQDYYPAMWALNERIRTRFAEEGIEIPYNQLDVHVIGD